MRNWARSFTTGKFSSYRWCTIGDAELGDRPSPDVCLGHHFFCAAIHHDDVIGTALINCDGRTRAVLLPILRDFPAFVVSVNRGFRAPGCPMLSTSAHCRWNSRFLNPCLAQRCEAYPEHLQTGQLPSGTAAHQSSSPDILHFFLQLSGSIQAGGRLPKTLCRADKEAQSEQRHRSTGRSVIRVVRPLYPRESNFLT